MEQFLVILSGFMVIVSMFLGIKILDWLNDKGKNKWIIETKFIKKWVLILELEEKNSKYQLEYYLN